MSQQSGRNVYDGWDLGHRLTWGHLKVTLVSGMGFFTDAYDLFIIGIAVSLILSKLWHLNAIETGILSSMAIWTAVAGQLLFGRIGDLVGRKAVYGIEAAILSAGAVASALSPNFTTLLISRAVMGFGIGGDYPISATIASEYAPTNNRGKMIAYVFSMQGFGIAAAVAVAILSAYYLPPELAWRVMLGVGAIPPAFVIYYRRKVPETPRYSLLVRGDERELERGFYTVYGRPPSESVKKLRAKRYGAGDFFREYWKEMIGTTVPWFLMDIAFYGTGIYSGVIVPLIVGSSKALWADVMKSGLALLIGIPGYFMAAALVDKVGRKSLQILGFAGMALAYVLLAMGIHESVSGAGKISYTLVMPAALAVGLFGFSFIMNNLGPNTITFVLPAEIYPVRFRTTGHGISAASGKVGAGIATLLLPTVLGTIGLGPTLSILATLMIAGAAVTAVFVPETKSRALEEVSREKLEVAIPRAL